MSEIPEALRQKLAKLMALEKGARDIGSIAEAENAAARIQEIILKYNLDLDKSQISADDKVILESMFKDSDWIHRKEGKWMAAILTASAKLNLCIKLNFPKQEKFAIIGRKSNIELAIFTAEQLRNKILGLQATAWKNYTGPEKRGQFKRGFLMGASNAVVKKLYDMMAHSQESNPSVNALVISRSSEVSDWLSKKYTNIGKSKTRSRSGSSDGLSSGISAGQGINLNKGINTTSYKSNLLG